MRYGNQKHISTFKWISPPLLCSTPTQQICFLFHLWELPHDHFYLQPSFRTQLLHIRLLQMEWKLFNYINSTQSFFNRWPANCVKYKGISQHPQFVDASPTQQSRRSIARCRQFALAAVFLAASSAIDVTPPVFCCIPENADATIQEYKIWQLRYALTQGPGRSAAQQQRSSSFGLTWLRY